MASPSWLNLPNAITIARIVACPGVFWLALSPKASHLFLAFVLFLAAALSDLWDGYLARKHGLITTMGKLLDPLADKLLMVSTFLPFYLVTRGDDPLWQIPWWGVMPLWVVVVIFGRELFVTVLRSWAARRGAVIASGKSGKIKAFIQNIFSGSLLLWFALVRWAESLEWTSSPLWQGWAWFHGAVTGLTLLVAILLTLFSLGVYLVQNRRLFRHAAG
jgi:CDP-diacylglycerol--glycerol-3-phosphate 3-phosphatidyltransferase